jgi:thymidylate kinase
MAQPEEIQNSKRIEIPEELELFIKRFSRNKYNSEMFLQSNNKLEEEIQNRWDKITEKYPNRMVFIKTNRENKK